MNKDVIPFIPASFGSFVGLLFTFGVLGIVIHVVQPYQTWCWQVVMAFAGQKRWDEKIRVPHLEMLGFLGDSFLSRGAARFPIKTLVQMFLVSREICRARMVIGYPGWHAPVTSIQNHEKSKVVKLPTSQL
jgi:hypothetical protein